MKVLIISLVVAVVLGGGAFAVYKVDPFNVFSDSSPAAAEAVPANAVFYVGVDLNPSAGQKVKAVQFLDHFPAFRESVDISDAESDIREPLFDEALQSSECDLNFNDDIQPWLGYKFAFAGMPASGDSSSPDFLFAAEVSNEGDAREGLDKLASCGGGDADYGLAFADGYALIAETQEIADGYVDDLSEGSLADDGDFTSDLDSLGDLGFATMWVDVEDAINRYAPAALGTEDLDLLVESYQRAAATFSFESDSVEVVASVFGNTEEVDHEDNKIVDLPDTTAFAMSESGGKTRVDQTWETVVEAARKQGVDVEEQMAAFEAETGLSLPDDIATVLGDNILFAVDSEGLSSEGLTSGDPSQINAGVRFTSDPDKLNELYEKVLTLVQDETGQDFPVSKKDVDDGLVVATNDDYADTLSEEGTLGDTDAFQSVVDDGASKEFVLFFNFDSIEDQVVQAMQDDGMGSEEIDNVTPIQAFGFTFEVEGDYTVTTFRMSVND